MARRRVDTRAAILKASRAIVKKKGVHGLTFDAVADRLKVSKQAVLYWFPTKEELVAGVALPGIGDEAEAGIEAVRDAGSAADAIRAFIDAIVGFHLDDLDRFRLIYVAIQAGGRLAPSNVPSQLSDTIHRTTGEMYRALAEHLDVLGDPHITARHRAVVVHMAALGLVLMVALGDAVNDPLAHSTSDLVAALSEQLAAAYG